MRHFLSLTTAPGALARCVFQRPTVALLIAPGGALLRLPPTNPCAALRAVMVAAVTTPADAHLPGTTPTAIQPIALFAGLHEPRPWHWTTPRIAGIKALQNVPL